MYNRLLMLYQEGRLTEQMLSNAVKKGWITEVQKQQMLNQ
jgi:hypothetical protein